MSLGAGGGAGVLPGKAGGGGAVLPLEGPPEGGGGGALPAKKVIVVWERGIPPGGGGGGVLPAEGPPEGGGGGALPAPPGGGGGGTPPPMGGGGGAPMFCCTKFITNAACNVTLEDISTRVGIFQLASLDTGILEQLPPFWRDVSNLIRVNSFVLVPQILWKHSIQYCSRD